MGKIMSLDEFMKSCEEYNNRWYIKITDKIFPNGIGDHRAWHTITHPWKLFFYYWRQLKFSYQRIFRGWDDSVCWSLDTYLAEKIPLWVKEIRENKKGTPIRCFGENNWNKFSNSEYFEGSDRNADMKYNAILKIIEDGFKIYSMKANFDVTQEEERKIEDAKYLFMKYFETLWT